MTNLIPNTFIILIVINTFDLKIYEYSWTIDMNQSWTKPDKSWFRIKKNNLVGKWLVAVLVLK